MVRALILYYLSIKSTHGYEIQKFIQFSGMDQWSKIQSGSIYYALNKLEKDGLISLAKEEKHGARIRKIYAITDKGRSDLEITLKDEFSKEISSIGSDKFIISNMMNKVQKNELVPIIEKHIKDLREKHDYWVYWRKMKVVGDSLEADKIAFDMNISSIEYQIKWHEALLNDMDSYIKAGKQQEEIIRSIDFGEVEETDVIEKKYDANKIQKLREEIIDNPEVAKLKIDELISLLTK